MRSAVDVLSAFLAALFVAFALVMATGIGLQLAPDHAEAAPAPHAAYPHHHEH